MSPPVVSAFVLFFFLGTVCSKLYDRCDLARELYDVHELPMKQIATWVCIARHESEFNTSAINLNSGDHGLFQISQLFWCSPPGYACGISCTDLRNDNIEDDVICARRVFREHKRLSGDGFNAWVVYRSHCKDKSYVDKMVEGCFDGYAKTTADIEDEEKPLPPVNYYPNYGIKDVTTDKTSKPLITTEKIVKTSKPIVKTSSLLVTKKSSTLQSTISFNKLKTTQTNLESTTNKIKNVTPIESKKTKIDLSKQKGIMTNTKDYTYSLRKTGFYLIRSVIDN